MNVADELARLQELHHSGAIDDQEFAAAKARILGGSAETATLPADPATLEREARQWGMLLHLSIFAGFVAPALGLVVPILIWQIKKDELPGIDEHGKNVANWIISKLIYAAVSFVLAFVLIGFVLGLALAIVAIVFPVIGGIKANNGEYWKYPLAIPFFK